MRLNKDQSFSIRPKDKEKRALIAVLLIMGLSLFIHLLSMNLANLLVEEAYYWNYAQHLDLGYLDHPPMIALLIKLSTAFWGSHEFSVRLPSLFCLVLTLFFSYKLTELIQPKAGLYALMLLAILPFFFVQSLVITPDLPLLACWSATLYSLYRALILKQGSYWYAAGIWLGLGLLSKYTIALLGLTALFYTLSRSEARFWLRRKEPYLGALLAFLLFSPVIYWNATHQWASFLFQTKRRFIATSTIDLPYLVLLILLFITPYGLQAVWELIQKHTLQPLQEAKKFVRFFLLAPLGFFIIFSLNHEINLNWIGPLFLALIPWLACLMSNSARKRTFWMLSACFLLLAYSSTFLLIHFNASEPLQEKLFIKVIHWEALIKKLNGLAQEVEQETHKKPIFVPLDNFPIGSELAFYQSKLLHQGLIQKNYPIIGPHIFGLESLMYRYWSEKEVPPGTPLILISKELWRFSMPKIEALALEQSELKKIWSYGQGQGVKNIPFYYKVIRVNSLHGDGL